MMWTCTKSGSGLGAALTLVCIMRAGANEGSVCRSKESLKHILRGSKESEPSCQSVSFFDHQTGMICFPIAPLTSHQECLPESCSELR